MIADRRRVDAEPVHGVDCATPVGRVRKRRALHLIAGIQPYGGALTSTGEAVEPRFERRNATDRPPLRPIPHARLELAVQITRREHAQQRAVPDDGSRRRRESERRPRGRAGGFGNDGPARMEIRRGLDRACATDLVDQQLANVFALVVDHRRVRDHRVRAATGLPVAVHRHRERVAGLHDLAIVREATDAQPRRSRQIDVVGHAADHVVVVAGDAVVDDRAGGARFVGVEVARGMLEVLAQLLAADLHGAQRVFVRIDPQHVPLMHLPLGQSRLHIERRRGRELRSGAAALHFVDEVE